jgi:hypothetical protein
MITKRSDTPTGMSCLRCEHAVIRPWGARPDEYLVCDVCVAGHAPVPEPVQQEVPDLSDSFWRIVTADQRK